jgi:threonine/homoserine/homoserine lactone efflux protein
MNVLDFAIEVIGVSVSGVFAPGPLFFTNVTYGIRLGTRSGLCVAYGHTLVELPLIVTLAAGLFTFDAERKYAGIIGLFGGIAALAIAGLQIRGIISKNGAYGPVSEIAPIKRPFIAGVALSAFNPFFLLWWSTAGLKLIADSSAFGVTTGLVLLFSLHIWMDYVWLGGTAFLASKGSSMVNSKYYRLLLIGLSAMLVYYGISFLLQAASEYF